MIKWHQLLNWKDIRDWFMDLPLKRRVIISISIIVIFVLIFT